MHFLPVVPRPQLWLLRYVLLLVKFRTKSVFYFSHFIHSALFNVSAMSSSEMVFIRVFQALSVPQSFFSRTSCCQLSKQCFEQGLWCLQGLQGRLCSGLRCIIASSVERKDPALSPTCVPLFISDLSSDITAISCAEAQTFLAVCQTTCQSNNSLCAFV